MTDFTALKGASILFDLDGTLVESAPDLIAALNSVLIAEELKPLLLEEARPFISRGAWWLLEWSIARAAMPVPATFAATLFERFIVYYSAHIADNSHPFAGVIAALAVLKAAGAKLVVCTNKPTALSRSLLTKLGMVDMFDDILGIDAVTAAKPDAAHLIEAVRAVGGNLNRAIMVGDAGPDAGAARAAGIPLILVDFGYSEIPAIQLAPDILLRHFGDLVDACLTLLDSARVASSTAGISA